MNSAEKDDSTKVGPVAGDFCIIDMAKPFLANDVYSFTTSGQRIDNAAVDLSKIKVVPNPYIVTNSWEPMHTYSKGRGPREIHFTHLPQECTIKIFNIRGQLVRELEHNSDSVSDGMAIWDMQTKDLLDISYGIYIYHVDAGGLGSTVGKFAVVK